MKRNNLRLKKKSDNIVVTHISLVFKISIFEKIIIGQLQNIINSAANIIMKLLNYLKSGK